MPQEPDLKVATVNHLGAVNIPTNESMLRITDWRCLLDIGTTFIAV